MDTVILFVCTGFAFSNLNYYFNFSNSNLPDVTGGLNANVVPLDTVWMETKSKKAALKLEKLDTDLKNYKSNSIKESIR